MVLPANPFTSDHLGISLSSTALRGLLLKGKTGMSITAEQPFTSSLITTHVTQPDQLVQAIKNLKNQLNYPGSYAAVCLPEKFAFSRQHILPAMDLSEVHEAIRWQLEKIFPFPAEEIYADWKLLSQNDKEIQLLVTAIPRVLLDSIKLCFESAGLYPVSFEPSASALSRLLPEKTAESSQIIMEVEQQGTVATLILNHVSVFTTTTIFSPGTPSATVLNDITINLSNLINRIPPANPSQQPTLTIVMTGEKASSALSNLIQSTIHQPTQLLTLPNISPAFHLAYAAATATIRPPTDTASINLLPTTLQTYYQANIHYQGARRAFKLALMGICLALVFSFAGFLISWLSNANLTRQINKLQETVSSSQVSGINLGLLSQKAQRFIQLYPKKTTPEQSLSLILDQLPPGITLTSLSYTAPKNEYSLSGVAQSRAAIITLKDNLDAQESFSKIIIPLSALENSTNYPFILNFTQKKP